MENSVINRLRYKEANGSFTSYPIGPELRYVGKQVNSNVNNLEEQLILDRDINKTITESIGIDPNTNNQYLNIEEVIKYKTAEEDENYYILQKNIKQAFPAEFDTNRNSLIINLEPQIIEKIENLSFYEDSPNPEPYLEKESTYTYTQSGQQSITTIVDVIDTPVP